MPRTIAVLNELFAAWNRARPPGLPRVVQLCLRPAVNTRAYPEAVELCCRRGAIGDRWEHRTWMYLPDGRPDPRVQVALMDHNVLAFLQQVTGCSHHPGDTLLVDLDLHEHQAPVGTRFEVGSALIEISDVENDGCARFARHYGDDVLAWIRAPGHGARRLRGAFARVVRAGSVRAGDAMVRLSAG